MSPNRETKSSKSARLNVYYMKENYRLSRFVHFYGVNKISGISKLSRSPKIVQEESKLFGIKQDLRGKAPRD